MNQPRQHPETLEDLLALARKLHTESRRLRVHVETLVRQQREIVRQSDRHAVHGAA